ncbi:MAG: hypothetical protein ACRD43_04335, partial [Pyrinomonadaceae bacterium]
VSRLKMTIKFKRIGSSRTIAIVLPAILIVSGVIAYAFLPPLFFSSAAPPDLVYFQGKWNLTVKSEPETTYTWTVADGLRGAWLNGVVEKGDESISRDLWRANAGVIERYVFTSDGSFIKLVSYGWKSGKMVLNGISYGKAADSRVRETITRESERRFRAVWERQGDDGKWTVFSDETCSK